MPRSSAIPRIRACIAAKVPSACHRCNQRCVALFDPHWGPCGTSHQRQPVIKMYNKVFRIFRNGAWGIPRLRFGGAGGKTSSNKRHSKSLTPSNRPAILPSYVQIEQYSTKIILVGYIHVCAALEVRSPWGIGLPKDSLGPSGDAPEPVRSDQPVSRQSAYSANRVNIMAYTDGAVWGLSQPPHEAIRARWCPA